MIKKFPTKLTFVTKSKTFKTNPKHTIFHAEPIAKKDMAAKIAASGIDHLDTRVEH